MKLLRGALRSVNGGICHRQFNRSIVSLTPTDLKSGPGKEGNQSRNLFETDGGKEGNQSRNLFETADDFENRILSKDSDDTSNSIFRKIGLEKGNFGQGMGSNGGGHNVGLFGGSDDSFSSSLQDGMEGRLKKAATYFEVNPEEVASEAYTYRPDVNLKSGVTYTPEDLNLRKPGVWRPSKRMEFEVTTKEVLQKADFRNVKFLANFLTEAGIIIKRSQTGISAKAQRKIAREIKTARAFGLLPFTTMGTKSFVYGKTMEDHDHDFEPHIYDRAEADDIQDPVAG